MSKPKAPAPPDPTATAAAQTGTNVGTAVANTAMGQVNQVTPDGNLTYSQTGTYAWTDPNSGKTYNLPQYTATTSLSPEAQKIRDASNSANLNLANLAASQSSRAGDLLSRPIDLSSIPEGSDRSGQTTAQYGADLSAPQYSTQGTAAPNYSVGQAAPTGSAATALPTFSQRSATPTLSDVEGSAGLKTGYQNDFSADRKRIEDALYERMNPQMARDREDMERNLANRGIKLGSAEYDRAMGQVDKAENDARVATVLAGGQEQSRLANLARDEATFGNTALQQELLNRTGATQYGNDIRLQSYGLNEDARRYGDDRAAQTFSLAEDQRRYGDDRDLERYALNEDRARYGDTLADRKYGMAEEQRRYGDSMEGQRFIDQQAIQGRADANQNNQFNQRQALLDALDRRRSQSMQEQFAIRNQPINEITALLSGSQVGTPNFNVAQPSTMPTTDVAGVNQQGYANQMAAWQQKMQQQQALMGGLFGLGSAGILASDVRLKKDIEPVGEAGGHKVYAYHYKHERPDEPKRVGVMAQEVERTNPDAVVETPVGKAVDYRKLGLAGLGAMRMEAA